MTRPLNSTNSEIAICSEVPENTPRPKLVALTTNDANNALSAYSKFDVLNLNTGKEKSVPSNLPRPTETAYGTENECYESIS